MGLIIGNIMVDAHMCITINDSNLP